MAKIGFCAVAGSGMSALAQILNFKGDDVYGSDRAFDQGKDIKNKKALEEVGIKVYPQDGSMLDKSFAALYISTAVEDTVADIRRAKELNIPIMHRSDLLAEIFGGAKYGVAVGGTSGKSTVTAMVGYILDRAGKKPLVVNGALLKNYENRPGIANVILNDGDYCVIEADESDGSIEKYVPAVSVVTNITLDHKPIEELQRLFGAFAKRTTLGAVFNKDCVHSRELLRMAQNIKTFSIEDETADFYAKNITAVADGTTYEFLGKTYRLNLIGEFNVANALCAAACCSILGVEPKESCKILEGFLGTKRRLEVLGCKNNITVIDDFAHNPDKVNASVSALKSYSGRLIIMFQPHGFAPMRLMGREIMGSFARHLDKNDILLLPEIFFAGGSVTRDISSLDLVEYAKSLGVDARFYATRSALGQHVLEIAGPGDRIVLMGARDNTITDFGFELLENL